MKNFYLLLLFVMLLTSVGVFADALPGFKYVDATELQIINKAWDNTTEPYTRLTQQ